MAEHIGRVDMCRYHMCNWCAQCPTVKYDRQPVWLQCHRVHRFLCVAKWFLVLLYMAAGTNYCYLSGSSNIAVVIQLKWPEYAILARCPPCIYAVYSCIAHSVLTWTRGLKGMALVAIKCQYSILLVSEGPNDLASELVDALRAETLMKGWIACWMSTREFDLGSPRSKVPCIYTQGKLITCETAILLS
jgi:hypothetical protein